MGSKNDGNNNKNSALKPIKPFVPVDNPQGILNSDGKILYEAAKELLKGGITQSEGEKLEKIDAVLKDASAQLQKNGSVVITDNNGKSIIVR